MIGVAVSPGELDIAQEFFELFKTPWEPAASGRSYCVVVSTVGPPAGVEAGLLIAYGSSESAVDRAARVKVNTTSAGRTVDWGGASFPLYRGSADFDDGGPSTLRAEHRALDYRASVLGSECWRVGYDLFDEVRYLLTEGQPPSNAQTPTLDLHIDLLRTLLTESGIAFIEVAPHPAGSAFICCLTHDIDFYGIRRHLFDRTFAGFAARASMGSLVDCFRGRRTLSEAFRNWVALVSFPLVLLGILPDFWRPIESYEGADGSRPSTFFVVPFRDRAGVDPAGRVNPTRAVRYQAGDVSTPLAQAAARGRELAVHGIDAWRDAQAGRDEKDQVASIAGQQTAGVRMHWLYFSGTSPAHIEAAGFDYDSTCGYNDAVGYRAGTSQVFRLPGTEQLMELPLAIMDTALFYSDRLNLSRTQALARCSDIIAHAKRTGGTIVVNWHDRSLAPERLWGRAYKDLLGELDGCHPWFARATDTVEWFRWRRSVTFVCEPDGTVGVESLPLRRGLPGASVVVRRPASGLEVQYAFLGSVALRINL